MGDSENFLCGVLKLEDLESYEKTEKAEDIDENFISSAKLEELKQSTNSWDLTSSETIQKLEFMYNISVKTFESHISSFRYNKTIGNILIMLFSLTLCAFLVLPYSTPVYLEVSRYIFILAILLNLIAIINMVCAIFLRSNKDTKIMANVGTAKILKDWYDKNVLLPNDIKPSKCNFRVPAMSYETLLNLFVMSYNKNGSVVNGLNHITKVSSKIFKDIKISVIIYSVSLCLYVLSYLVENVVLFIY